MTDITQVLTDPNLCAQLQTLTLTKFTGLAGAPAIAQAVQYLKEQWGLPTRLAPIAALGLGIAVNVGIAAYMGLSLTDAIALGAATGLLSSGWHIIKD